MNASIPPEFGDLSNLTHLELQSNQLTGAIPTDLGRLSQLETLFLSINQLSGQIPTELGNLSNLSRLVLSDNQLTGPIPPAVGNLPLIALHLSSNQLTGPIPTELGSLSNLQAINLSSNQLEGPVPLPLAVLGGLIQENHQLGNCNFRDNIGLFIPDSQDYRNADVDGDGVICSVMFGLPASALIVGTWEATSYLVNGTDLIAGGMAFRTTFTDSGFFLLEVTGDLTDLCEVDIGETDCTRSGPYSVADTELIFEHPEDGFTVNYTIDGPTMTWTGTDGGTPVILTLSKVGPAPGNSALVGTWEATSYLVDGADLIAGGMKLSATFTASGTYLLAVTNDLTDLCEPEETACTRSGPYSASGSELTITHPEDGFSVDYEIDGSMMTWTLGDITLALTKAE